MEVETLRASAYSPGRTSQNRVPAGPGAGRAGFPCRGDLPDPGRSRPQASTNGVGGRPLPDRQDAELANTIAAIHRRGKPTGAPASTPSCVLRAWRDQPQAVWRCMKLVGLRGVHRRRWRLHRPAEASWPDLVNRQFRRGTRPIGSPTSPRTAPPKAGSTPRSFWTFLRRVVGWSIADHLRTELVADALTWPGYAAKPVSTVVHSDRGTQPDSIGRRNTSLTQ